MATSSTPPPMTRPAPGQTFGGAPGNNNNQRFVPQRPPTRQVEDEDEPADEPDPNPPNAPVFTFPLPGQQNGQPGNFQAMPPGANGQPVITINPYNGVPQGITINPVPNPGTVPTFGAPTPGMIVAPPPQPGQPGIVVRPPGPGGA